jgi:hypothetical protein
MSAATSLASRDARPPCVIQGKRMARKFDTPAKPRILALQEASAAKQMAMADMYAAMSLGEAAASGPLGAISAVVMIASTALSHAEAAAALKKGRDFFEWTCADAPASATADLGERADGDVSVHGYQFFVQEQGQYHGPVEVDIAQPASPRGSRCRSRRWARR